MNGKLAVNKRRGKRLQCMLLQQGAYQSNIISMDLIQKTKYFK